MVEPRPPPRAAPGELSTGIGDGRRQKWLPVIPLMPRSRSITKPWPSYFRLETENSIVNSQDTDDLTAPQKRCDLQSKNCRNSCYWVPASKSRRSGSTALKCAACTIALNFRLRGVLRRSSNGHAYATQDRGLRPPFRLKGVDRVLPPGDYEVVTDEELIEGLSFPVYHRVSTAIIVPAQSHQASSVEMVVIDPRDLRARGRHPRSVWDATGFEPGPRAIRISRASAPCLV